MLTSINAAQSSIVSIVTVCTVNIFLKGGRGKFFENDISEKMKHKNFAIQEIF